MATRVTTWSEITAPAGTEVFAVDDGTDNKKISLDTIAEYSLTSAAYGSLYFSTPAGTVLTATTPGKAAGTTADMQSQNFTASTTNRLTYDGDPTTVFLVQFTGSVTKTSGGSLTATFSIYKDGTEVTGSEIDQRMTSSSDTDAFGVSCLVSMDTSSYVELWIESSSSETVQIETGVLSATAV
jgi:hypothetical protein